MKHNITNNIVLRPHHLQCLKYYVGNGYSKSFVENMNNVVNLLKTSHYITLKCELDDVCKTCPNKKDNKCITQDKVIRYDRLILEKLNLKENETYDLSTINEIVKNNNLLDVCNDCEWHSLCLEIEAKNSN